MKENKIKSSKKNTLKKKYSIKNMGIDIDKNEYYEIILSNSNHPEATFLKEKYDI